jgi:hypothetical protein
VRQVAILAREIRRPGRAAGLVADTSQATSGQRGLPSVNSGGARGPCVSARALRTLRSVFRTILTERVRHSVRIARQSDIKTIKNNILYKNPHPIFLGTVSANTLYSVTHKQQ